MYLRGKKASLSLSVNAIVVLILAIVLLAFGLSFITKLLGKGEQSLEGLFPSPEVQPTSTRAIAIPDSILLKAGSQIRLSVGILNTLPSTIPAGTRLQVTGGEPGCPAPADFVSQPLPNELASGQIATIKLLIKGSPSLVDNSICTVKFGSILPPVSYFLSTKGSI